MKMVRAVVASLACCLLTPAGSWAQTPAPSGQAAAPTQVQQVVIGEPDQRLALIIWSPSPAADEPGRSLPLVVISHGTGAGPTAHVDTAQALAESGFVVVAPMHRGDNFQDDSNVGKPEWMASRSADVGNTIDYMLEAWDGRARIDAGRIGIFGFSAGATTALIASGGVPDLDRISPHCASRREFVCDIMQSQARPEGAPPVRWTHDRRIAAAVVAAPGLGFAFEPGGLAGVTIPVQLRAGAADQTVPYASNSGVVRRLLDGRVDFHEVPNAVHLSFLTPCGPDSPPQICQDNPGFDRAAFHSDFNRAVIAFFRTQLRASNQARN